MDSVARCPGCAVELPAQPGATSHRYFNASPECWGVFGEVLAAEYGDASLFAATHQLSVDTYAAQHAGGAHPHKSVAIHLVGLALVLEWGLRPTDVPPHLQVLATETSTWPVLENPSAPWTLTVLDAALAEDPVRTVRCWAEEVWKAWQGSHDVIRRLATTVPTPPA